MKSTRQAVLLIGSAKRAGESTSEALGAYLATRLRVQGVEVTTFAVHRALRTPARTRTLLAAVDDSDLLMLAFPLYVDTLPALVTQALETIAAHRHALGAPRPSWLLALANCGFPEAAHNEVALEICQNFAAEAGMRWAGGLALGAGGAVHGGAIAGRGMTHTVARALDLTAAALSTDQPAPEEALALMRTPLMPGRLYTLMGNLGWHRMAQRNRVWRRLDDRPLT
ncbi:hypothetical protein [Caldilinea sp.]|uniref:hypothetical protein n=1 Tax=Caldilinea sp. TaxID=2293560 RepID=UPI002BF143D4|nr:hypothetical protein [Anaerolineales bacterium]HQY93253.1 hypothetical protein [Caldilinea sp.]